jgi:hypothetical protein
MADKSPDTEREDQGLETPDMGGGEELAGEGLSGEAEGQLDTVAKASEELSAFLKKKGLKSAKDLMVAFEEKERKVTDLSNQVLLGAEPRYIPPAERPSAGTPDEELKVEDSYALATNTDEFNKFLKKVDGYIEKKLQKREDVAKVNRMTREAFRLRAKDPAEFERVRPLMVELAKSPQYAEYSIPELFEVAKTQGAEMKRGFIDEVKKELGLDGIDTEKLKSIAARMNPAAISTSSGGGATPEKEGLTDVQRREQQIKTNILKATKLEG